MPRLEVLYKVVAAILDEELLVQLHNKTIIMFQMGNTLFLCCCFYLKENRHWILLNFIGFLWNQMRNKQTSTTETYSIYDHAEPAATSPERNLHSYSLHG